MTPDDKALAIIPAADLVVVTAYTRARTDDELIASWLDGMGSDRTRANFAMTADRFMGHLAARGLTIRSATVEDIREIMAELAAGKARSTAVQYAQRVKSLLSYAHRLGFTVRVNSKGDVESANVGAAIKIKPGTVDRAKRIASETEIALLIRSAPTKRDRLLLQVGYAGGLRVSELVNLRWADVVLREAEQVQLSVLGKGDKLRHVLLPAIVSRSLLASRGAAAPDAPLFPSRKGGEPLLPRAVNRMIKAAAKAAGVNPAISAHWLRHAHASHALENKATLAEVMTTLGHSNVATTSVYLHAKPNNSSGLKLDEGVFLR